MFWCYIILMISVYVSANANDADRLFHYITNQDIKKLKKLYRPRSFHGFGTIHRMPSPDAFNEHRCTTPLAYAIQIGNLDVVKFLFKHSKDPNKPAFKTKADCYLTALQTAILFERVSIVSYLIKKRCLPCAPLNNPESTESILVARTGNQQIAQILKKLEN